MQKSRESIDSQQESKVKTDLADMKTAGEFNEQWQDGPFQTAEEMREQEQEVKQGDNETILLDSINRGLRKWKWRDKLSFDDGFDLLIALQEEIVGEINQPTTEDNKVVEMSENTLSIQNVINLPCECGNTLGEIEQGDGKCFYCGKKL